MCKLLLQLEASLDQFNIDQFKMACEVLIEVLQGNTSGKKSTTLLETKRLP